MDYGALLVVFLEVLAGVTLHGCVVDRYCICNVKQRKVHCSRLSESVDAILPNRIPDTTKDLKLERMWVDDSVQLYPRHFAKLRQLMKLDLSYNRISHIYPRTFSDMKHLRRVNLSHNRLKILEPDAFSGALPSMHELNLSHNLLLVFTDHNLKSLVELEILDLRENPILVISGEAFADLSNLKQLSLSSANFTKFPSEPIGALTNLRTLHMRQMPFLKLVPSHAFSSNLLLEELTLEYFPLTTPGFMPDSFSNLVNLRHLTIKSCNLTSVPSDALEPLKDLETLDLSRNSLEVIFPADFATLTSLTRIVLHSTFLREIKVTSFTHMAKLMHLDVSSNRLKTLYREAFPEDITLLQNIIMSDNAWSCDCSLAWIANSTINLGPTTITCTDPPKARTQSLVQSKFFLLETYKNCSRPSIKQRWSKVTTDEGTTAILRCQDVDKESFTYTWFFNGKVVSPQQSFKFRRGVLEIVNAKTTDAGEYVCVVRNAGGEVKITVQLNIEPSSSAASEKRPNVIVGESQKPSQSGGDCYTDATDYRSWSSKKNNTPRPDRGNATTSIVVGVVAFVTALGVAGVFIFIGCMWNKKHENDRAPAAISITDVPRNGSCNGSAKRKTRGSLKRDDGRANERLILGGHGIYSRPLDDLQKPRMPPPTNSLPRDSRL